MKLLILTLGALIVGACAQAVTGQPSVKHEAQAVEFFEKHVRPVLAENCYACHGDQKQQAGLRLDSRAAMLRGTDTGHPKGPGDVVLTPGEPEKSALVRALRYTSAIKMPPAGKLAQKDLEAITEWVKAGAPWPATTNHSPLTSQQTHWAFQPVKKYPPPSVKSKSWVQSPIDQFILARLEQKGLAPSPPADRRTLIRRATYDLIGLPTTTEEVEAFVNDKSSAAFNKVVDRLLASPRYGERWGRYWLDVARYADTKGYVFQEERRYPYAYTYRDWVIRALNEDLPYDQFLIQQIAADRLLALSGAEGPGDDKRALAAMGFLTLGRRFLNNQADIIDDRLDVVCRGTMALTVQCARCHDHKFDPIPTKDYYSLYGVFASSVEPRDLPLLGTPERTAEYVTFEKELRTREDAVQKFKEQRHADYMAALRAPDVIANYLLAVRDTRALPLSQAVALSNNRELNPAMGRRWKIFLDETAKSHHPLFTPWHAFAVLPEDEFPAKAAALAKRFAANATGPEHLNGLVAQAFAGAPPVSLREVARRYGELLCRFHGSEELKDHDQEALRQALVAIGAPLDVAVNDINMLFTRDDRNRFAALQRRVDEWRATSAVAPPRAMSLEDASAPMNPYVFVRGNPGNRGPQVPRQFLAVIAGEQREPFRNGSGRLELAQAIASKDNPLTARVMVNRLWGHHFGAPLVRTPSDFGTRSEPPTHPELLDYLAARFTEDGWSIKNLHRLLMGSAAYQQTSALTPNPSPSGRGEKHISSPLPLGVGLGVRAASSDPENTLLSHFNRQRLDFEALRDSLLFVSGQVDLTTYGASVDLTQPGAKRRAVYGFIDRQNLPNLFRTFDFASPDTHSPQRFQTTVPQQALFMMNSPFVIAQAKGVVARVTAGSMPEDRVRELYRLIYGREATKEETCLGLGFINACEARTGGLTPWEAYAQVLLLANEFVFVD